MHRIALALTVVISLAAIGYTLWFLVDINKNVPIERLSRPAPKSSEVNRTDSTSWIHTFTTFHTPVLSFPVEEMHLSYQLDKTLDKRPTYLVEAFVKDPYQLFCLKQVLIDYGVKYDLQRGLHRSTLLKIYSFDEEEINILRKTLLEYEIKTTIKLFKAS